MRHPSMISVVIISKDEPELETTIMSVLGEISRLNSAEITAELIVVDRSSGRLDFIRKKFSTIHWFDFDGPLSTKITIPHQRNFGVARASGDVIVFIDCGAIAHEGWLKAITSPILAGSSKATCGHVIPNSGNLYGAINDFEPGTHVQSPPTCNFAIERSYLRSIGGFDESFAYGSDADLNIRIYKNQNFISAVAGAEIDLDWGGSNRNLKRGWLYGSARAKLVRKHPDVAFKVLAEFPTYPIYGLWLLGLAITALSSVKAGVWPFVATLAFGLVPLLKNISKPNAFEKLAVHLASGASFILALFGFGQRKKSPPVLHWPKDAGPYQHMLLENENQIFSNSTFLEEPTGSAFVNLALLPLRVLIAKQRGAKILHVHWLYLFSTNYLPLTRITRGLAFIIYRLFISAISAAKLDLIWTCHNLLPHSEIFTNDVHARKIFVDKCDLIICHSDSIREELISKFNPKCEVVVIPQGVELDINYDTAKIRNQLGYSPQDRLALMFGRVEEYKGFDWFLEEALKSVPEKNLKIQIIGECRDEKIRNKIQNLVNHIQVAGGSATFRNSRISDVDLRNLIRAANVCVFPFRKITNSGSLNQALASGTMSVSTDQKSLAEFPGELVFRASEDVFYEAVVRLSSSEKDFNSAAKWGEPLTWQRVASQHLEVYAKLLKK